MGMSFVDLNGKNILVTGGNGFIGSNFIELIYGMYKNMNITNVDMMDIGSRDFTPPVELTNTLTNLAWHVGAINPVVIGKDKKFDYVFHFAAQSHVDRSIDDPEKFILNNVMAISRLLNYVRENSPDARVINISTDEVYGHLSDFDDEFLETSPLNPRSPYSASKASADLVANAFHSTYGLDIITTRCCNNYGPNQHDEKFIPTIIRSVMQGKKIPVYGRGENIREWIYVDDHNKSILEIAKVGKSGMVYNIGSGEELNNINMIIWILDILYPEKSTPTFYKEHIQFVEDRKGHDHRYALASLYYDRVFELTCPSVAFKKTVDFYAGKFAGND